MTKWAQGCGTLSREPSVCHLVLLFACFYVSCVGHLFVVWFFGSEGLYIMLFLAGSVDSAVFATACGWQCRRTLAVAAGAIQITLTRPRQGFLTFFWLLLEKNKMHTGGVTSESRVNHMWRLEKDFGANQVHSSALGDRLRLCEVWLVTCVWSCSCGTMWNSPSGKCFSCALLENLW